MDIKKTMRSITRMVDRLIELENIHCGGGEGISKACGQRCKLLNFIRERLEESKAEGQKEGQ